jgi:hypothetical protein
MFLNGKININNFVLARNIELSVVIHTCNPSYLEGGDQGDHGLRPDQAKSGIPSQHKKAGCGGTDL